jgi:biotin carboxylase
MNNYVWLVGGGVMQKPMAERIILEGYNLIISDYNPHCVCREYAHKFVLADIYNPWETVRAAEELGITPVGVLSPATDAGPTVSLLAEKYNCHAANYKTAKRVKDKIEVREADGTIPFMPITPETTEDPLYEWSALATEHGAGVFPCVVKPADSSGSVGFGVARNSFEFSEAVRVAKKVSSYVIVEEYLESKDILNDTTFDTSEIATDNFVLNGVVYPANSALRLFWGNRPGIEAGHFNPGLVDNQMMKKITSLAKKLGVTWGPFKVDFKRTEKYDWVIMEAATRLSGGFDHMYTCPMATGKDLTGEMLRMAVEGFLDEKGLSPSKQNIACCYSPIYESGTIRGWDIDCSSDKLFVTENRKITEVQSNRDRHIYIINVAKSKDEALRKCLRDTSQIRPIRV